MKEYIYELFLSEAGKMSQQDIFIGFSMALLIGMAIYTSYRFSHSGAVYSSRFNVSLVMLTVITTLVMTVIGNNIALSLGMVGALSIVRFRTAIKDPRDTAYIFWSIAAGICCGVYEFQIAGIGSAFLFLFLLLFGKLKSNDRYLLVVRGDRAVENDAEVTVSAYYRGKARMRVKNTSVDDIELIYELSQKIIDSFKKQEKSIMDKLYEFEGIRNVNLICQNDELGR